MFIVAIHFGGIIIAVIIICDLCVSRVLELVNRVLIVQFQRFSESLEGGLSDGMLKSERAIISHFWKTTMCLT